MPFRFGNLHGNTLVVLLTITTITATRVNDMTLTTLQDNAEYVEEHEPGRCQMGTPLQAAQGSQPLELSFIPTPPMMNPV